MIFGYNTNSFSNHALADAIEVIANLGYASVALTIDHHALNPFAASAASETRKTAHQIHRLGLRCVIETGARFLLDPWRKHQPTLLSRNARDRKKRLDFLFYAIDLAKALQADAVSFWSGSSDVPLSPSESWNRLAAGCQRMADYAERRRMRLAFEPEPGMFIDTLAGFTELTNRVRSAYFGLTADLGHLRCMGELPFARVLPPLGDRLWNVHIEDIRGTVHEHLMFGEGDMNFAEAFDALRRCSYAGALHVELSRHSHDAVETARRALAFLRTIGDSRPES